MQPRSFEIPVLRQHAALCRHNCRAYDPHMSVGVRVADREVGARVHFHQGGLTDERDPGVLQSRRTSRAPCSTASTSPKPANSKTASAKNLPPGLKPKDQA
jgi:hypothetical protein